MNTIPEFDFRTHFNPAEAGAMRSAFDTVCRRILPRTPQDPCVQDKVKQEIAEIIVALATAGVVDEGDLAAGCLVQYPPRSRAGE